MSGLSSNFGMPVSMYSGQAAVAQTAMSMSSMPGKQLYVYLYLYLHIYTFPAYLCFCLYSSSARHVPDVGNVRGRIGSHLGRHHQLLSLPRLLLPPRLRHAQLRHRGHDLVHHEDGLSFIPGVCVIVLISIFCEHLGIFCTFICVLINVCICNSLVFQANVGT